MDRITITIDRELATELDRAMQSSGYKNRSEAIRTLTRLGIKHAQHGNGRVNECVGALVYLRNNSDRNTVKSSLLIEDTTRELVFGEMFIPIDPSNFIEITLLRGASTEVRTFTERMIVERAARHGRLVSMLLEDIPAQMTDQHGKPGE